MDFSDITTMLTTLVGVLAPIMGGGVIMYRKQNKRLKTAEAKLAEVNVDKAKIEARSDDWQIWKDQLEAERQHVKFKDERISELLRLNAEKEDRHMQDVKDWEERFTKQTEYLRGVQRGLVESGKEKIKLVGEIGELKVELAEKRCDDHSCPFRKPPNAHTPPAEGLVKEEYFKLTVNDNGDRT